MTSAALRILLVEDHQELREALARHLRNHGCHVGTAGNGAEGLDRLGRETFDFIVSDIDMPLMDGVTFYRRALARDDSLRDRFLLCSAATPQSRGLDASTPFLPKPFTGRELLTTIVRLHGRAQRR